MQSSQLLAGAGSEYNSLDVCHSIETPSLGPPCLCVVASMSIYAAVLIEQELGAQDQRLGWTAPSSVCPIQSGGCGSKRPQPSLSATQTLCVCVAIIARTGSMICLQSLITTFSEGGSYQDGLFL